MTENTALRDIGLPERRPPQSQLYPWYDSGWLTNYTKAKAIIRTVRPEALAAFVDAFRAFQTRSDFQVTLFDRVFDDDVLAEIRHTVASLKPADLKIHEARTFGRFVVHDHPFFTELQQRTVSLVSEAVGEPVEAKYNFLSLYTTLGVCPLHMDSPEAKWTLDLCIDQSVPWPIYFSQVLPWPESEAAAGSAGDWEADIKQSFALRFSEHTLRPGQAVVFSGSSQWHYRESIPHAPGRQFCDLLFFHFVPRGTSELVQPRNWARLFDIPDLSTIA
ncbi:MAG: hypothetical protein HW392_1407 [Steroidobacteraceae bacterium]|nr:hypothetical protein [Steroidobacteraceae bacterium]